ncbi:hypothetical protein EYF80_011551 [Liparis tanakae]|uniref:Uncharacterized protein n=1 Tax=Liparis tanakae TaxID=230148 RepID=A0A4Z2IKL0_9TELE|nr:hypothetical protein EYF80_011551 [Liparis tanakae]
MVLQRHVEDAHRSERKPANLIGQTSEQRAEVVERSFTAEDVIRNGVAAAPVTGCRGSLEE